MKFSVSPLFASICLSVLLSTAAQSCSKSESDEPTPETTPVVAAITGDDYSQVFQRDKSGNIRNYTLRDGNDAVSATYMFHRNGAVEIATDLTVAGQHTAYNDTVYISRGLAQYATGSWLGIWYRIDFSYDGSRLASVKWTQWNRDDMDARRGRPWNWTNSLEWDGANLARYIDWQGGGEANRLTSTYTYSQLSSPQPFQVPFTIMPQYLPLQLDGIFGSLPANLIDTRTIEAADATTAITYSYTIKGTRITGFSEEYTGTVSDGPRDRRIEWDE